MIGALFPYFKLITLLPSPLLFYTTTYFVYYLPLFQAIFSKEKRKIEEEIN